MQKEISAELLKKGVIQMTNMLWFSRHVMSEDQISALETKLGEIKVTQCDMTITHASEIQSLIDANDIIGVVAPIGLQAEFLKAANGKPVIIAESERKLVKAEDGSESKAIFVFKGWKQLKKIEVVMEPFA
jgi:hypothetical protein